MSEAGSDHTPSTEVEEVKTTEEQCDETVDPSNRALFDKLCEIDASVKLLVRGSEEPNLNQSLNALQSEVRALQLSASHEHLQDLHEKCNDEIQSLQRELTRKTNDNRKLHGIFQAAQNSGGLSDEEVDRRFGSLKTDIQNFCRRNIHGFRSDPPYSPLTRMRDSDKEFWMDAYIACRLHEYIFTEQLFDVDHQNIRNALIELERRLAKKGAPRAELNSWRAETVQIVKYLGRSCMGDHICGISSEMMGNLMEFVKFHDSKSAKSELVRLCETAYQLALKLRESKVPFEWRQTNHEGFDQSDFNIHRGYQELNEDNRIIQGRILFGAVFKMIDGGILCIRKGELLVAGPER